ncbi:GNAT family N-acetyltransferase [Flavivirga algicola]|uniref:GNAT family N-acetyltransferase n=1 Tax=Flavivirga algicola TaxID=2729136 RepID=A0ABX1S0S0_9FLAO|nr:GNAT family N-acetyltransferase [Flavivirga algicola]NMH89472.1 GNAT family N-acetyltransferase [Flavivirga algicola]
MTIIQATTEHLDDLVPLFDGYRVFYRQTSNLNSVKAFLKDRLTKQDSVIYIAYINDIAVGFTQLYFLFSSVSMKPMYVLNDLYIDANFRSKNIGTILINKAKALCKEKGYKGLIIQTEPTNPAQHLYQRLGFIKDKDLTFFWKNEQT